MIVWSPTVGGTLSVAMELTIPQDSFAVAIIKDACVVGHVSRTVSRIVSFFLEKDGSVGICEVTGAMVNRGAGFRVCTGFMDA